MGECQTNFVFFTILILHVYNYSTYVRIEPTFNHYYHNLREEANGNWAINWLSKILWEKWTFAWDGGRRWGHMITNLAESIFLVLKKSWNLPTSALVKPTYIKCNAYSAKEGQKSQQCRHLAKFIGK